MAETKIRTREGQEIWETTTPGRVWVTTTDARGKEKDISAGGKIGDRLRISTDDREINQDQVQDPKDDPFVNGLLRRIDADQNTVEATMSDQAYSTEELTAIFAKSGSPFQSSVRKLNELNCRRLKEIAELVDASASQMKFLDEHISATYKVEGTMPSYNEMLSAGLIRNGGV